MPGKDFPKMNYTSEQENVKGKKKVLRGSQDEGNLADIQTCSAVAGGAEFAEGPGGIGSRFRSAVGPKNRRIESK